MTTEAAIMIFLASFSGVGNEAETVVLFHQLDNLQTVKSNS